MKLKNAAGIFVIAIIATFAVFLVLQKEEIKINNTNEAINLIKKNILNLQIFQNVKM